MVNQWESYLLRTREQYEHFCSEHGDLLRERSQAFKEWVCSLPLFQWVPLKFNSEGEARAVIGLLCVLYWQNDINITFSSDMRFIRNDTCTQEELNEWIRANFISARKKAIKDEAR